MHWLDPRGLDRAQPLALLALRLFCGVFLIDGVWDNITDAARMDEFATFLRGLNCPWPEIAAPVSVWAQFAAGVALIPGVLTRWAGLLIAVNFIVAVALIAPTGAGLRDLFPPGVLVFVGFVLAAFGAGALSLDAMIARRGDT
jgi:putative oxidoreductase